MSAQPTLFDGARMSMRESIDLTLASLQAYGPQHRHWAVAWSGGKDSTALVTFLAWACRGLPTETVASRLRATADWLEGASVRRGEAA